ncbi:MAG: aminotransferase class III-fold pyridoxal phosphate-dependent enzyme, partial [Anaerovoracaceae bacterium]
MNSKELRALDAQCIEGTYGRFEPVINQGKGAICTDLEGKTYVDFTSGIGVNSLGFCDEQWVQAVCKQVQTLQHTSNLFYTLPGPKVAEKLTARTGMSKVFFGNSGAEANECAIKAARKYGNQKSDKKNQIVTLRDSFHGRTMATVSATGQDSMHKDFDPFVAGFQYCETNDMASLQRVVGENTCAVMIELIQGEGGVHVLDEDFVKEAEALCRKFDALLIVDEVQTGVGRTGYFFAYEPYGIKPDLITFAKGMGGGLPIGGVIFSDRAKGALSKGDHGSTFGANP